MSRTSSQARCHASRRQAVCWSLPCLLFLWSLPWVFGCTDGGEPMRIRVGRQDSELTRVWGQPSEVLAEGQSGRTLIYTSYWLSGFGKPHLCRRAFTTDGTGTITSHSASDCA